MNRFMTKRVIALVLLALMMSAGAVLAEGSFINRAIMGPVINDASTCTSVVNSGQSIQAVLSSAQPGSVICVRTGVYKERVAFSHNRPNITLKAYPGETPVIDGQRSIPTNSNQGLVHIEANGAVFEGFEVRNSAARGMVVASVNDKTKLRDVTVRNNTIRDGWSAGIIINGSVANRAENILIEGNRIFNNLLINETKHTGGSAVAFIETMNSTARGNIVYRNYGEGLVADRWTTNLVFEDNIVYDHKHSNIYLSATINPVLRRNLVFCTDDRTFWRSNPQKPGPGITLRDESFDKLSVNPPPSEGQIIINNIVTGCGNNFWVSTQIAGGGLINAIVANNTFANARGDNGSSANSVLIEGNVSLRNTKFVNNIMFQPGGSAVPTAHMLKVAGTPDVSTFTLANNLYSIAPTKNWFGGENNRLITDPRLVNPVMPTKGNVPDAQGYRIQSNSPAINAGASVSQVTEDFFKEIRSGVLDIGADEFGGTPPRQDGRIVVTLATTPPGSSQAFSFTTSYAPGSFQLTDGGANDSGNLTAGTYSVSIASVAGWVTNGSCDDGSQPGSISVSANETVTCAFTAQAEAAPVTRVIVIKETIPANDPQSFQFSSDFAGAFTLSHSGRKTADVAPGTYSVSETLPSDWVQQSATCSDGSAPAAIDVAEGETVTCTFVNRKVTTGGDDDLNAIVYVTPPVPGSVDGINYSKGDILAYDSRSNQWALFFDGSDVGISRRIDDFVILNDGSTLPTMLMVLNGKVKLNGPGGSFKSEMQDVVRFRPTRLGENTAGAWDLYFDGSDVALSAASEKIDALSIKPDGTLLISTTGKATVNNSGGKAIVAQDEDLLAFTPSSTGDNTSGTWALELDATKIAGMKSEDVNALWFDSASGTYYVGLTDNFNVAGVSGTDRTILAIPGTGAPSIWWDAATKGYTNEIDGLHIVLNP